MSQKYTYTSDFAHLVADLPPGRYVARVSENTSPQDFSGWSEPFEAIDPPSTVTAGQDLDLGTGKILYSNVYQTLADLPDAASYHGMFAHVHAEGAAYYAHAGNWVRLADDADVPTAFVSGLNGLTGSVILAGGDNVQIGQSGNQLTISSTQTFTTLNGESGTLSLVGGGGISVASVDGTITVSGAGLASESFVNQAVAGLVNSAPQTLDTLAELANALNNDSDFAANVTTLISQKADANHEHVKANITDLTTGDLDMQGNRVLFANYYATQGDFPDPTMYHGMVAHSHADGAFYGAHAGAWVRLANQNEIPAATSVNTLTGGVALVGGDNINVTTSGQNVVISGEQGGIVWSTPPQNGSSPGSPGDIAYDDNYLYLRTAEAWRQVALSPLAQNITISQQPTSQAVEVGQDATFTVLATAGGETITYQWAQSSDNGSTFADISGATSNSLTVTANLSLDGYQYRASLSAPGAADVTTSVATLTVAETFDLLAENGDRLMTEGGDSLDHDGIGPTLTITSQPQNTTASGGEASFAVAATVSDGSALTYQWEEERLASDGATWVQRTLPAAAYWRSVTYGNETFVAVTGTFSSIAATSTDGATWTQRTLPALANWCAVTYGNGTFVAVTENSNIAATSPDGITWTQRTLPASGQWYAVAYGNGTFVALDGYGSNAAATSTDGITWTQRTLPSSAQWRSVTYGNGTFVAVASGNTIAATSPDGITWTQRTMPTPANWWRVTYGNGTFVAVTLNNGIAATSTDGINWTQRTLPTSASWFGVTYGNGAFVAVAFNSNIAATSPDGITWTQRTLPASANWSSVIHGGGTFVAVAGENIAATSNSTTLQFLPLSGETASTLNLTGLTAADDGERYRVVVDSPSVEPVTSDVATLSVPVELAWTQVGADIDGGAAGNDLGPVALNSNGTVMVVGEPGHDGGGLTNNGLVTVYADNGTAWVQRGLSFAGAFSGSYRGQKVDISADGNAVILSETNVAGGTTHGWARRFVYDGTSWTQSPNGGAVPNTGSNQQIALAISGDGDRVAIVYRNTAVLTGALMVWDVSAGAWDSVNSGDVQWFSSSSSSTNVLAVALNIDGSVVCVGDPQLGYASIWEDTGTLWGGRGTNAASNNNNYASITGSISDQFGSSVSLTSNGNRLAVGAPYGNAGGTDRGYVRVYDWSGTAWSQVGSDITGVNDYDYAGWSVDISSDGGRVVVGLRGADGNGSNSGTTRIYDYNGTAWVQVGGDIEGSAVNDYSGSFVTISGDGTRVGIGAPGNDDGGAEAGQARVFEAS